MVHKIAFLGLDNAGKSSIITVITKRFGFEEEVSNITPTRKIRRDTFRFLGLEFIRLDFGGQAQYREDYIKNPGKYLGGTDLIYYVIDAQDYDRYNEANDYLEQILVYFKEEQFYPPILILFHKVDPELIKNKDINQRILTLKQILTKFSHDFDIFFLETSIYDIKSIMDSFSSGLSLIFDKIEMVSNLFAEISKNYNTILMTLFDSKGITVGEYYKPHLQLHQRTKIYDLYIEAQKRIVAENKKLYEFSDKFDNGPRFSGVIEVLTFGKLEFFLMFIV
ncbi:MAG: ADP-ribosylation factor-like protein, partial [Candidatus Hermodarchaeota archaeon]